MTELPLTLPLVMRIWWAILWRQAVVQVVFRLADRGLLEVAGSYPWGAYPLFLVLFLGGSVAAVWWALSALRRSGILLAQGERETVGRRDRARAEAVVEGLGVASKPGGS